MSARLVAVLAGSLLAACSSPSATAPAATRPIETATQAAASPTPASSPALTPLPSGAVRFTVLPERSVATVRVREQIADVPLPGDAVLTASAFRGGLVLLPDGTCAPGSTISIDLDALKSDSSLRDEWIKVNTLQTRRFPRAEFTAMSSTGLPLPLPSTGEWQARLKGTMNIHGVDRELTWQLLVTRRAGEVRVKGTTAFTFGDYGMAVPANRMILSVVDDIRLEVDMVATE
jgi:polyisoprenoid-binding protein YceI